MIILLSHERVKHFVLMLNAYFTRKIKYLPLEKNGASAINSKDILIAGKHYAMY